MSKSNINYSAWLIFKILIALGLFYGIASTFMENDESKKPEELIASGDRQRSSVSASSQAAEYFGPSPFGALQCKNSRGEHLQTTQCNPDWQENNEADQMEPYVAAQHILNAVLAGDYEKVPELNSVYHDCWLKQQPEFKLNSDKLATPCNSKGFADIAVVAAKSLELAAHANKPGAVEAYRDWLFSAYQLKEMEFKASQSQSNGSPASSEKNETVVRLSLDDARDKLIQFLEGLPSSESNFKALIRVLKTPVAI